MFGIFRNKTFKALDKVYANYDTLHKQYREYSESTNELYQTQATIIRGQLYQVGAAFDLVVAQEAPSFLQTCIKEFGYIPYTSLAYTTTLTHEKWKPRHTREILSWVRKHADTWDSPDKLTKLMSVKYARKIKEVAFRDHADIIQEARDLKMLNNNHFVSVWDSLFMVNVLEELYYFPKEKCFVPPEATTVNMATTGTTVIGP